MESGKDDPNPNSMAFGRLDRMELENFKSYGGKVVVGPFMGFNAVVGTNGSGKSNLMDAISFVLGVRTSQLRGNQLRDLVYRNLSDPADNARNRKATVKLFYKRGNAASEETIVFARTVTLSGSSEYRVNKKVMSLEKYNRELAKIGILVKARNFLVFQNEVEGIASKSPSELTELFEDVSGSAEFKNAYRDAEAEKDSAEEQVTTHWQKRKGMAAEKRQYKQQKEEAEKYQRLQAEVAKLKTMQVMFQLFHLDNEIEACKHDASDAENELDKRRDSLKEKHDVLMKTKEEVNGLDKCRMQQERKLKRLQDEIDKFRPQEVRYKTEISGAKRRMKGDERNLEKAREHASNRSSVVDSLDEELTIVEAEITELKKQIDDTEHSHVSAASMAEYRSLKEVAATRTSALQQAATVAEKSCSSAAKQRDAATSRYEELKRRYDAALNDFNTYTQRNEELGQSVYDARSDLDKLSTEKRRLSEAGGERERARRELERTVQQASQALRDVKADKNESARERAFNAALESMQRLFPGVLGRLSDLCKPTQPRYREAIAVVFGKLMNAIVVDNDRTGSECISFMKDQRAGMATFIPLQSIRPKPVEEALRRLGGTARLVVDVVDHNESIAKAVQYAAANAVVCDTLDEARRIRYDDGRKVKICSLDGTLINKAGFMTGGTSRSTRDRAAQWDRSEIEALKRKRAEAQDELNAMGPAASDRRSIAALAEKIDGIHRRVSILELDRNDAESRASAAKNESQTCERDISLLEKQVRSTEDTLAKAKTEFETIQGKLHGLENELFGDFAQRHGIDTVQEFESKFVQRADNLRERLLMLETKQSNISSRLKYESSTSSGNVVERLKGKIAEHEAQIVRVETSLENLLSKRSELLSRAEGLQEQITKTSEEREEKYAALRDRRQEFRRGKDAINELETSLSHQRSSIDHLRSKRQKILTDARVAQIHVCLSDECTNDCTIRAELAGPSTRSIPTQRSRRSDDMEIDQTNDIQDDSQDSVQAVISYSMLPSTLQGSANANADVRARKLSEMAESVASITAKLDSMAPNMRAKEHMADVASKLAHTDREADKARDRAQKANASFQDIISKRESAFRQCFDHVAGKINEIYKQLTMSTTYTMGGTAYLSLEQQGEPYLGGIKYNAMPPTKRFRDMDQLSGGERTVAALALLFAIHDYRPSPFFVLDEIDAALDNLNVGKVSNYIRSRSSDLQTIVISLKDAFFEKADMLVGIYRDQEVNSSRLLTLDLREYPDDQQVPPSAV